MDKCSYFLVFLVLGGILTFGQCFPHKVDITSRTEAFEYVVLDSNNNPLENFTQIELSKSKVQATTTYHTGQRESGDHLVGRAKGGQTFILPVFVSIKFQYPKSGVGALVTFVQCVVEQLLNAGKGYIISGGVGQHHITFVLESYFTTYFYFDCNIYGK
uniref:Putative conserved secreted protein n=1 Tax=Tabanus bromius TaxID=304241 RepID=A0A0K8TRJ5_TABBR